MIFSEKKFYIILLSLISFFTICCLLIQPFYQTNDDVLMMWMTEGIAAHSDEANPFIVYQHFILGYLYKIFPNIFGISGYNLISVLLMISFFTFAGTTILGAERSKKDLFISGLIFFTIVIIGFINFQFTIISSICFGSFLFLRKSKNKIRFLFLFISFLIRIEMGIMMTVIFFLTEKPNLRKTIKTAVILIISYFSIFYSNMYFSVSHGANQYYYNNKTLWKFLNNRCGDFLLKNYEKWNITEVSKNDIALVNKWFLIDQELNKKITSKPVISNCDMISLKDRLLMAKEGFFRLFKNDLIGITLLAILLIALRRKRDNIYMILAFFGLIAVAGFFGRPSQVRIYYGPLIVLIFYMLPQIKFSKKNAVLSLILTTLIFYQNIIPTTKMMRWRKKNYDAEVSIIKESIEKNPGSKIWWWGYGGTFLEWLYPLTKQPQLSTISIKNISILWGHRKDPYSLKLGSEFKEDFTKNTGVNIIFYDYVYEESHILFERYCEEKYLGKLTKNIHKGNAGTKLVVANFVCQRG